MPRPMNNMGTTSEPQETRRDWLTSWLTGTDIFATLDSEENNLLLFTVSCPDYSTVNIDCIVEIDRGVYLENYKW